MGINVEIVSTSISELDIQEHYNYITDLCGINGFDIQSIKRCAGFSEE